MMDRWLSLIVAAATMAMPFSTRADCVSECQASTYCDSQMNASGECGRALNNCYLSRCNRPSRLYGAIAYGAGSMAFGYAYDLPDAKAANRRALANCAKHGDDCEIVTSFSNSCAAVAAGNNSRFAVGQGGDERSARAMAADACRKAGGTRCEIQAWSCTGP